MSMRTVKFTFDPGPKKVTADDVVRSLRTLLGATGDLADWQINHMRLASPLVIEASCPEEVFEPIAAFSRDMVAVSKGRKPRGAMTGLQAKLLDAADSITAKFFGSVEISPGRGKPAKINRESIDHARQVTGQLMPSLIVHRREQMGQLRGYLEQITTKKGKLARFGIRDRVTGELIPCVIPEGSEDLLKVAASELTRRVIVTGLIHYGEHSQPTSIQAMQIEPVDEYVIPFDKLPRVRLTEDGDAVGYIRRLRDA